MMNSAAAKTETKKKEIQIEIKFKTTEKCKSNFAQYFLATGANGCLSVLFISYFIAFWLERLAHVVWFVVLRK